MPIAQRPLTPHGSLISSADCPQIYSLTWTYHFVYYKNFCCYTSLFCIVQSYKDTILVVVAQCFKMIATAYDTSYEKPQETTDICPKRDRTVKAFLWSGVLVAKMWSKAPKETLYFLHGLWHTRNEPSWMRDWDDRSKTSHLTIEDQWWF